MRSEPAPYSVTLELTAEGEARFRKALEGMRQFNPTLTPGAFMLAIFLYGLDKVELEIAVSNLPHDKRGRIITPD